MQCIEPEQEFTKTSQTPDYCDISKTDYEKGCNLWSTAISKVHDEMSQTNKNYSANLKTEFSECRETFVDQIQDYNDNNIFEIKSLKKNWFNESTNPISNLSCKRSVYGAFYSNGPNAGQAVDDVNTLWKNIIQDCKNQWKTNNTDTDGSKTKVLDTFFLNTDYDAAQSSIKFTYNCIEQNARMYTKCNRPGWESMTSDPKKGWIPKSSCTSNPVYIKGKPPPSCSSTTNPSSSTQCPKNYNPCAEDKVDTRPRPQDPTQDGCCLNCGDWKDEYATYFSYGNAMSNETVPNKTESYHDFLSNACDTSQGNCCVKKSVTNDHTSTSMCTTCSVAQNQNSHDMSDSKITFFKDENDTTGYSLNYVGAQGIAITPTANTSTSTPITFSDVRACNSGELENQCNGLRGCNGFTGTWYNGDDSYCINGRGDCITDNACNYGFSYLGSDQAFTNPALNCANVYTLSRAINNCQGGYISYDSYTPNLTTMKKMTIPEGAWVTAYHNTNVGTWNTNLCDPTNKDVLMMGCGRDQGGTLRAFATSFVGDSDGKLTAIQRGQGTMPWDGQVPISACVTAIANEPTNSTEQPSCTFSNMSPIDTSSPKYECYKGNYFQGYTFGFMPGYYKTTYTTKDGPCTSNAIN